MRKGMYIVFTLFILVIFGAFNACQQACINQVFLETLEYDLRVNNENLGVRTTSPRNGGDTIRSVTNQFYNYPEFRRFGKANIPPISFITSAYAADDCPEQVEYISRMDADKTTFSLDITYDATAIGEGIIDANTNLLSNNTLKNNYLSGFETNPFLLGGAPTFLTLDTAFFTPINNQWVTFYFSFEEEDGTIFTDSTYAFIGY